MRSSLGVRSSAAPPQCSVTQLAPSLVRICQSTRLRTVTLLHTRARLVMATARAIEAALWVAVCLGSPTAGAVRARSSSMSFSTPARVYPTGATTSQEYGGVYADAFYAVADGGSDAPGYEHARDKPDAACRWWQRARGGVLFLCSLTTHTPLSPRAKPQTQKRGSLWDTWRAERNHCPALYRWWEKLGAMVSRSLRQPQHWVSWAPSTCASACLACCHRFCGNAVTARGVYSTLRLRGPATHTTLKHVSNDLECFAIASCICVVDCTPCVRAGTRSLRSATGRAECTTSGLRAARHGASRRPCTPTTGRSTVGK